MPAKTWFITGTSRGFGREGRTCRTLPICPVFGKFVSLADEFGIEMSDQEAQSYRMFMQGPINSYRRLKEFVVPQADTDSARTRLLPLEINPWPCGMRS